MKVRGRHAQTGTASLEPAGGLDTEWDAVYETALTGTARIGLLVLSFSFVWAGFSLRLQRGYDDRNASIQLAIAVAAMEESGTNARRIRRRKISVPRADLATAASTSITNDVHVSNVVGTVAADGTSMGGARTNTRPRQGRNH